MFKNSFIGVTEKLNLILWPNPCFVSSLYVSSFGRPTCSKHRCLIEVDCSNIYLWFHIKVTHFFTSHCAFKPLSGVSLFVYTIYNNFNFFLNESILNRFFQLFKTDSKVFVESVFWFFLHQDKKSGLVRFYFMSSFVQPNNTFVELQLKI